jgi:transcriptional regulator with XRE-family HTH domain
MSNTSPPERAHVAYVGSAVAKARARAKLTQLELAHAIGLSGEDAGAAISRLENGVQEPRLDKLIRIAGVLRVPLDSLLPV